MLELKAAKRVKIPYDMIEMVDIDPARVNSTYDYNCDPTFYTESPSPIHRNGCNALYCDGHVAWKPIAQLIVYITTPGGYSPMPVTYPKLIS